MNDLAIIDLYFKRDETAITLTQNEYGSRLTSFAYSILKNTQDSEESVSDTYIKAWDTIPPQRPVYFYAYLNKICRFICFGKLDYMNAKKRNAKIVELSDELNICSSDSIENAVDEKYLAAILEKFLDSLSKPNRVIFLCRYWQCESIEEISKHTKFSQSKIKTSLHRTREKLKKYLESEGVFI